MTDLGTQQDPQGQSEGGENANIRHLRERADLADQLESQLKAAQLKAAVLESGVDAESPLGKFFLDNYSGDVTDVDALKAEAGKLGVPFKGQPAEGQQTPQPGAEAGTLTDQTAPPEPTGTPERQALADGAQTGSEHNPDPRQASLEHAQQLIARGVSREDARAEALNMLANSAMQGDRRATVPETNQR